MPAIRDWTWTYTTSTTGTTITIPRPAYQEGDLLFAVLSTDTGTQTWSSPGWTVLFSQTNTTNLAVLYKIAGSSEPESYTFTYTTAETANGSIFSIMDVDTTTPIANNQIANFNANRLAMPTTTVARANSLIMYLATHGSTAVQPSIIEGPITFVYSNDGSAHADAVSWGFQTTTGSTPSNVYVTVTGATYNGVLATVVINPPSTGATVIPPHCAEDSCVYVDPIHGVSAFRGNTAFAATATTYWTGTLAGRTLANATVSAKTDYGINTFRSAGGMTGPTSANTYQGATLVLADANRVDVEGKNILVHAMPLIPADIQTVYDAGLGKGIEVGIASSADNGVVWHVHGANTPFGINRVPIIVNPSNTSGVIDSRGNPNWTLAKIFGFFTCGFLVSSDWTYTMIWVMGTTTVCGGNANTPIDIPDIARLCGYGHERISAMLQGAKQVLLYQAIQIGNGGTNLTYLLLDSSAIEFPEIYNINKRLTQYCSIPNAIGITYYAGANDTIIHRNSIISSASKYYWRFHTNTSTSATYNFEGLQVIGAGDIQVKSGLTLSGITFSSCDKVNPNGAYFDDCIFASTTDNDGALVVNNASDMAKVTNCTFRDNGIAIRLASSMADTYTFTGLYFEDNTVDVYVSATSGTVTINVSGGGNVNPSKIQSAGATVVVNNIVTITLTGLKSGSEVRIYESGTQNELDGVEESDTTFEFQYNYTPNTYVDIVVHHLNYLYYRITNYLLGSTDSTLPISQQKDRQYYNP